MAKPTMTTSTLRPPQRAGNFLRSFCGIAGLTLLLGLSACQTLPKGLSTASNFDAAKFGGTWYEIVRVHNRQQTGLTRVTSTFEKKDPTHWLVTERGWNNQLGRWQGSERTARTPKKGPAGQFLFRFSSPRNVVAINDSHDCALMASSNFRRMWVISKTPTPSAAAVQEMLDKARQMGFPTEEAYFTPAQ